MTTLVENFRLFWLEPNPTHRQLIVEHCDKHTFLSELIMADDTEEATEYLQEVITHRELYPPDLIIYGEDLSSEAGEDFLLMIKDTKELRDIPLFVFGDFSLEIKTKSLQTVPRLRFFAKPKNDDDFDSSLTQLITEIHNLFD